MSINIGDQAALGPRPIKALLLDDSSFDRSRIRRMSRKTDLLIDMDEVSSLRELDTAVATSAYDLILVDYRLPEGSGLTALDHVLATDLNRNAAKIMITGNSALDTAVTAMRGGCHDFLTKDDMDVDRLRSAVLNAMAAAAQHREMMLKSEHQAEIIRLGLTAALQSDEVQQTLLTLLRPHMMPKKPALLAPPTDLHPGEIDALLAGFADEDEFIFH